MKKVLFLTFALAAVAFANTGADADVMNGWIKAFSVLAAGLGGKLMTTMFIALAMIEAQVIYALVISLIVLYANPFGPF